MAEPRTLLELDGDAEGGQNLLRLPACLDGNNVVGLAVNEEDRRLCPEAGGDILRRNEAARIAEDAGAGPLAAQGDVKCCHRALREAGERELAVVEPARCEGRVDIGRASC